MINIPSKNRAFTIIETLVAITILMISIAGPMTIANKGLAASVNARDTVIASYLAQDAIEYIKNVKDHNILASSPTWLYGFDACTSSASCAVSTIGTLSTILPYVYPYGITATTCRDNTLNISDQCRLYTTDAGYNHEGGSGGSYTKFYRYFYIVTNPVDNDHVKLVVVVRWNSGTDNIVKYESDLFKVVK